MKIINPIVFTITKEEVKELFTEMVEQGILSNDMKLNSKKINSILSCVEGDKFLAKDIRSSIKGSILEVLLID